MAFRDVAMRGDEEVKAGRDLRGDLFAGHGAQPACGEFERQRHPFDHPADGGDGGGVFCKGEVGLHLFSPLDEQLDGAEPGRRLGGSRDGEGKTVQRERPFFVEVEAFARGDQQLDGRRCLKDFSEEGSTVEEVFEVIQQQQDMFVAQEADDLYLNGFGGHERQIKRGGGGGGNLIGQGDRRKRDEVDAMREVGQLVRGSLNSKAGFADATRAGEGEQAAGRVSQKRSDLGEFVAAPDEGRGLKREIVHRDTPRIFADYNTA